MNAILNHRWWVIAGALLLMVLASAGLLQLKFDTHYRSYFDPGHRYLQSYEAINDTFTPQDGVLFILAPESGEVFTPEVMEQVIAMTEAAWTLPYSERVDSVSNYQHTRAEGDELIVDRLVREPMLDDPAALRQRREIALNERDLAGKLVSDSGHVTAINVSFRMPGDSFRENIDVALAARELAERFRAEYPDTRIYLSGMIMGNYAPIEVLIEDNTTLVPIMWLVITALLILLFRSISATISTLVVILFSTTAALGLCGWVGAAISGPSSGAPIIIMTIAVADCVHILVSYFFATEHGLDKRRAIIESMRINLRPVFITSLTTAIGFLTMNFSDVPPFRVLGNAAATGVGIAFLLSVTLLPALMYVLPLHTRKQDIEGAGRMAPFARHVIRRRHAYTVTVGLAAVMLVAMAPHNEVNDQFVKYYDKDLEFRYSTDFAQENLSSIYDMNFTLRSTSDAGIHDPAYLERVGAFEDWLRAQPEVVNVRSVANTFKRLSKSMHGDDPDWFRLPDDQETAAQYFLLYEMSLPFGLDANNQVSFDKQESLVQITLTEQTTRGMLSLEEKYSDWLERNAPEIEATVSGVMLMFSHIGVENAESMIKGTTLALLLMSLVIGLSLRSVKMGLVSLVANVVPAGMAFGVWALLFGQVGLSVAVAVGMTLGIVVDNTVHLLSKFQLSLKEKSASAEDGIVYAFSHVGVALLICNCVLIAGFLILTASDFKLNSDLGLFTSLTFVLALIVDFLLVAPLLLRLFPGERDTA